MSSAAAEGALAGDAEVRVHEIASVYGETQTWGHRFARPRELHSLDALKTAMMLAWNTADPGSVRT